MRPTMAVEAINGKLADVIDRLRRVSGANIVVNWNALAQFGATRDNEVNLPQMKDLPVGKVLQLVLDQVSATLGGMRAWHGPSKTTSC